MEFFQSLFKNLLPRPQTNFEYIGLSPYKPRSPTVNETGIENHKRTVLNAMCSHLYTREIEYIVNSLTRSVITTRSVEEDFFHGDITCHNVIKDEHYAHALRITEANFRPPKKCRPVHLLDVEHHYPHRNTSNAEAPFSTEDFFIKQLHDPVYRERHPHVPENARPSFGNMRDIIFDWTRRIHHEIKDGAPHTSHTYYILMHTKTAIIDIKDPNKLRTIWGFPRPQNLAYIMFLWPLMAHYKRSIGQTPLLWGYETISGGWFKLNDELHRSHLRSTIVTLDKSRFDKYYSFRIQDDIDTMIRSYLDFDNGYMPTQEYASTHRTWSEAKSLRLERLWLWLKYSFRYSPIVLPDGRMYRRRWYGMPSGVYPTQLYDTIHFHITNYTVLFKMDFLESQILLYKGEGDDVIFKLGVFIQPNEHQAFLDKFSLIDKEYFNSSIRPEKSEVQNNPYRAQVLGYRNYHGLPYREPLDLLAQLYHTKATSPKPSKTMATAIGIAYASMGHDPRVYSICKDIYEYYAAQGYTPDERTFRMTFYQDVLSDIQFDKLNFPSARDIQQSLMNSSYEPPQTMRRFWPDWFISDF